MLMSEKFTPAPEGSEQGEVAAETVLRQELGEDERITEVTAQHLYDLREVTGFVSGEDLHDLFRQVAEGEPSPSGRVEVDMEALAASPVGATALEKLNSPLWQVLPEVGDYTDTGGELAEDAPLVDLENGTIRAQALYNLREATGFISGTDLHELFRDTCDGEPSPSGYTEISLEAVQGASYGEAALTELNKPTWQAVEDIREYTKE